MVIKDIKEFEKLMQVKADKIVNNVSEKVLFELQQHLLKTIYSKEEGWYKRYKDNGGFYDGWELKELARVANEITRTLWFNGNNLVESSEDTVNSGYAHKSRWALAPILNEAGTNGKFSDFGGAFYPRTGGKYWDEFIAYLDNNIWNWFMDEIKRQGL